MKLQASIGLSAASSSATWRRRSAKSRALEQTAGALYQTFPADEARRVLRRLEFHYVPKHASWLNMVEIEIGVLASQCLDRRIESYTRLVAETAAWEKRRNAECAASTGCSQPKKPAPKWGALTPSPRSNQTKIKESKPL